MSIQLHVFEAAGLGNAPYTFIGCEEKIYQACSSSPIQPGGTCDYCGTGIRYCFWIKSADNRKFKVGCDCFYKIETDKKTRIYRDVERAERKLKKDAAQARLNARVNRASETFESNPALFTDKKHPYSDYPAHANKTYRDYVAFLLRNAGNKGRTDACKLIEKAVAA